MLEARPKIECTYDYLKEHLFLQTSFPRSVHGYAVHYIRVLLSYQLLWGFESQVLRLDQPKIQIDCLYNLAWPTDIF